MSASSEPVSPKVYNEFLRGVELVGIRAVDGHFSANLPRPTIKDTVLEVDFSAEYEGTRSGFTALASYAVTFRSTASDDVLGRIDVRFALRYTARSSLTDEIWAVFGSRNLKVNSWPYAREFVQASAMRMEWPRFTLPVLTAERLKAR